MSLNDCERLIRLLRDLGHDVLCLDLAPDIVLVASSGGGRLFGPFIKGQDPFGWRGKDRAFAANGTGGAWNIGGERIWLAPEGLFNFEDPQRIIETYRVDPALDPGQWRIAGDLHSLRLSAAVDVELTGNRGRVAVEIERQVDVLNEGHVDRCGYRQSVRVRQQAGAPMEIVPWLIRQFAPGGLALVEAGKGAEGRTAFGAPPHSALLPQGGWWRVPFSGPGFMKTLYHRQMIGTGKMIYRTGDDQALVISPALADVGLYPETAPTEPNTRGQAASLFYDSGQFGAYGEFELYGHGEGQGQSALSVTTHCCTSLAALHEMVPDAI